MTKIEMAIQTINWKIERAEKEYMEAKGALERQLSSESGICNPVFIKQYADRMAAEYAKLENLNEQLNLLEHLIK